MSHFLPDDYWKGREKPKPVAPRKNQGSSEDGFRAMWDTGKEIYHIGKAIHKSVKSQRGGNRYLGEPRDYNETLEKAKKIKEMEAKAKKYHQAKSEIEDYETRRVE